MEEIQFDEGAHVSDLARLLASTYKAGYATGAVEELKRFREALDGAFPLDKAIVGA